MKSTNEILGAGSSYRDKLANPEWKRFARNMRERHNFACQICRRGNVQLQVHHWFYDGREPWQYDPSEVVVLCPVCHEEFHTQLKNFRKYVFQKLTPTALQVINGALSVALDKYSPIVFAHALAQFVSEPNLIERYAKEWST